MDTFFTVLVVGLATAYIAELLELALPSAWNGRIFKAIIGFPLAFTGCWFLDLTGFTLAVSGLASAFVASFLILMINHVTSKPQVIDRRR